VYMFIVTVGDQKYPYRNTLQDDFLKSLINGLNVTKEQVKVEFLDKELDWLETPGQFFDFSEEGFATKVKVISTSSGNTIEFGKKIQLKEVVWPYDEQGIFLGHSFK
jgi:hypothetical protein